LFFFFARQKLGSNKSKDSLLEFAVPFELLDINESALSLEFVDVFLSFLDPFML